MPMKQSLLSLSSLRLSPRKATLDFVKEFARTYQPLSAQC